MEDRLEVDARAHDNRRDHDHQLAYMQCRQSRLLVACLFDKLPFRRLDLISDFGAGPNDPFLLEFDSLFTLVCSDASADWRRGCQTLHLVWLTECILQRFRERDAHVRVVVFDAHEALWATSPTPARLARAVVLRHVLCLRDAGALGVLCFVGWDDPAWARFVSEEAPPLLLVSSGHVPAPLRGPPGLPAGLGREKMAFQALALWALLHRVPVALTTGLEFRGMQAVTDACSSGLGRIGARVEASFLDLCPRSAPLRTPAATSTSPRRGGLGLLADAAREALAADGSPAARSAARLFVLHGALVARTSIRRRALRGVPFSRAAARFLERACEALERFLPGAENLEPLEAAQLVDGRLYHALFDSITRPAGAALWAELGKSDADGLDELWPGFWEPLELEGLLEAEEGNNITDADEAVSDVDDDVDGAAADFEIELERPLLPVSSPVLDTYFESSPLGRPPLAEATGDEEPEPPVCVEKYHWHNGRCIVGDDGELEDRRKADDAWYKEKAGARGVIGRHWRRLRELRLEDGGAVPEGYHRRPTPMELEIVERWRAEEKLQSNQKYMKWLHWYAESLHGAGVHTVSFGGRGKKMQAASAEPAAGSASAKSDKSGKSKAPKPSKADLIIEKNTRRLQEKRADSNESKLDTFFQETIEPMRKKNIEGAILRLKKFIGESLAQGSPSGRLCAKLRLVELCEQAWVDSTGDEFEKAARLYNLVLSIHEEFMEELRGPRKDDLAALCGALCRMGYSEVVDRLQAKANRRAEKGGRPIGLSPARLQMGYGGRYMKRDVDPCPDGRVLFTPDRWQRDLLNVIDQGDSALVVAPTSAGKTFAAFYAMEKVLRADDDGICVFVSPTKALVNQVSAEVYARFGSKTYRDNTSVVGIKTRDYEHRSMECQVLVTVPAMLEIMLMSPIEAVQAWCRRIRVVILDEVHCIGIDPNVNRESGASEAGAVWEHILLLIRCPFLALSATISNPRDLCEWMSQKNSNIKRRVELVQFDVRYSDLRKHLYVPAFNSKSGSAGGTIRALHPFAALAISTAKLRRGGIPRDMALAPEESLQLYDAICEAATACGVLEKYPQEKKALSDLSPDAFFTEDLIPKARARDFETAVKAIFERWSLCPDGDGRWAACEDAMQRLSRGTADAYRAVEEQILLQEEAEEGDKTDETRMRTTVAAGGAAVPAAAMRVLSLKLNFLGLLRCLQGQDKLPVIGFCFDRHLCEELVLWAAKTLEEEEAKWRVGSPEGRRRMAERERAAEERQNARAALERQLARAKSGRQKEALEQSGAIEEAHEVQEFACEDEFTFVRRADGMSPKEYTEFEAKLWRSLELDPRLKGDAGRYRPLLFALRRGLGVHHAGLHKKFREAVEVLFRRRHIKVVLATGTLALGINMPCRTVVILGDSVFLTPLQYRQTSGRAGRRGFDDLGHVVFFGLPRSKVDRLLTADIPRIRGQFPLTVTLVLRAMCLYTQAGLILPAQLPEGERARCAERAADLVLGLLRQPLFSAGRPGHPDQVYHHVRFSLEVLRRGRLLGRDGSALGLAGVCQHLAYTEPANLAFAHLVSTGELHRLLEEAPSAEEGRCQLVLVLAHLFGTLPTRLGRRRVGGRPSPSLVRLPPPPPAAAAALRGYSRGVLAACTRYLRAFVAEKAERLSEGGPALPFSGLRSPAWADREDADADGVPPGLLPGPVSFSVRSPFSALAGRGDSFESAEEMAACVCEGVALEVGAVPALPSEHRRAARGLALNAYILDFYTHGQWEELVAANRLRHGDVWFALNDFQLILMTICRSLERLAGDEEDSDSAPSDPLVSALNAILERWKGFAEGTRSSRF